MEPTQEEAEEIPSLTECKEIYERETDLPK